MTLHHNTSTAFDFTTPKAGLGSRNSKWGNVEQFLGHKAPGDMLAMWIAAD